VNVTFPEACGVGESVHIPAPRTDAAEQDDPSLAITVMLPDGAIGELAPGATTPNV
jgi:hypothetical protein